jgi:putative PIN family toxin of toxin-antitoxin system
MRVVLDTNVLISGLFWGGNESKVLRKCQLKELENFISKEIIKELVRVMNHPKFGLSEDEIEEAVGMVLAFSTMVNPGKTFRIIEKDPSDNKFLECAYAAKAKYIISGDEHLLSLGKFKGIKILNARGFLNQT